MNNCEVWSRGLQDIKSIGPKRAQLFKKMGISTVGDLLYHFPREYDDRSKSVFIMECADGEQATIRGIVLGAEERRPRRGLVITRIYLNDGNTRFVAVWYNQPYIKRQFPVGAGAILTGKVRYYQNEVQLQVSDYEVVISNKLNFTGSITPIYPLTEGITQRITRAAVKKALDEWGNKIREFIPDKILSKYILPEIGPALYAMHFPGSFKELKMARRRFIFEEFFLHQIVLSIMRRKSRSLPKAHKYRDSHALEEAFEKHLPFKLTAGQKKAWEEIRGEMLSNYSMNRLLQGDTGSGKTVISAMAMMLAASSGYQAVMMVPTEILAEQHYYSLKNLLSPMGIKVELMTSGIKKSNRESLLKRLKSGEASVIVGTHAVIQSDVKFKNLSLVVIDEQHRFGVKHRALLRQKGGNPDVLVMTATPIPRTLAMTLYNDLDVSIISEMPQGRKPVKTVICSKGQSDLVYGEIKKELIMGRQAYIVCPLVEESEKSDLQAAVEVKNFLENGPLSDFTVALLHGRMRSDEQENIMLQFKKGLIDVLVSTTVIEVGVDNPNATIMAVIDADRFGIAQLHQLRGRVGRGNYNSSCFLISDTKNPLALSRLEALKNISDGFILAEKDLELRGPGELYGTKQWGELPYKVADPVSDSKALNYASFEARQIIESDPDLEAPEHKCLAQLIKQNYEINLTFD